MCNQTEQKKKNKPTEKSHQRNDDSVDHNGPSITNTPNVDVVYKVNKWAWKSWF